MLLEDGFQSLRSGNVRSHYLLWEALCRIIYAELSIDLAQEEDKLGWLEAPPRPGFSEKYITITDQLTLHNALGVLYDTFTSELEQLITVYLWSPKPRGRVVH
jgi:hypothetical protein